MKTSLNPVISEGLVLENKSLASDTFLMTIQCPEVAESASPGRFVKMRTWTEPENGGSPLLDRPFSIHRIHDGSLSLLYRVVGPATRIISQSKKGALVKISGSLGRGLPEVAGAPESMYLVGGGIGLAPLALAVDWLGGHRKAKVFYGERTGALQVDKEWLSGWAGEFTATVEDGDGYGLKGLVTGPLEKALAREPRPVFACGPAPMLAAVAALASRFGVKPWVSVESGMACGFGVCLTCSLPLIGGGRFRACQEGPVIDGSSIDWKGV